MTPEQQQIAQELLESDTHLMGSYLERYVASFSHSDSDAPDAAWEHTNNVPLDLRFLKATTRMVRALTDQDAAYMLQIDTPWLFLPVIIRAGRALTQEDADHLLSSDWAVLCVTEYGQATGVDFFTHADAEA